MKINQEKKDAVLKAVVGQLDAGASLTDNYIAKGNRLEAEKWVSCGLVLLESFLPQKVGDHLVLQKGFLFYVPNGKELRLKYSKALRVHLYCINFS